MKALKTANQNNFRLVRSCFSAFCNDRRLTPYQNSVTWEHEGFSCVATDGEETRYFRAVDACCSMCASGTVDYCFACKCRCQIDFEEI